MLSQRAAAHRGTGWQKVWSQWVDPRSGCQWQSQQSIVGEECWCQIFPCGKVSVEASHVMVGVRGLVRSRMEMPSVVVVSLVLAQLRQTPGGGPVSCASSRTGVASNGLTPAEVSSRWDTVEPREPKPSSPVAWEEHRRAACCWRRGCVSCSRTCKHKHAKWDQEGILGQSLLVVG